MNIAQNTDLRGEEADGARPWLDAAYQVLIAQGVDKIRIGTLAQMVESTRTAFYWHFANRETLLDGLIERWQAKNSGNFIRQVEAYAETVNEAVFNMFDLWLDITLFDAPFDLAVRNWAQNDTKLARAVADADQMRVNALIRMFERFDYDPEAAFTRAHTVYFTQIGYISMMVKDDPVVRIDRMPAYVQVYTGVRPTPNEIARFRGRHDHRLRNNQPN